MQWRNEKRLNYVEFTERKSIWDKTVKDQGSPVYVTNDRDGWRTISTTPNNQVWSYVFEANYLGNPKGPTGYLSFGIRRAAQYFLVFSEPWTGEVSDVILSYRKICTACSKPHRWTSPNSPQPCETCGGEHEWNYPGDSRRRGVSEWRLPVKWRSMSTVYSKDVLLDPRAPSEVLIIAAQRGSVNDRVIVAAHPSCPLEFLNEVLARDSQEEVRVSVAMRAHQGLQPSVIRALCEDESEHVRSIMACHNPTVIGEGAILDFAHDRSVLVRTRLAESSFVTDEAVRILFRDAGAEECKPIREALAHHPSIDANTELPVLTRHFEDLFSLMFYELLSRPDLTDSTLDSLRAHTELGGHLYGWVNSYGTAPIHRRIIPSDIPGESDETNHKLFEESARNESGWEPRFELPEDDD